jgi:hypothetical protein
VDDEKPEKPIIGPEVSFYMSQLLIPFTASAAASSAVIRHKPNETIEKMQHLEHNQVTNSDMDEVCGVSCLFHLICLLFLMEQLFDNFFGVEQGNMSYSNTGVNNIEQPFYQFDQNQSFQVCLKVLLFFAVL